MHAWGQLFPFWSDAVRPSPRLAPFFSFEPRDDEELAFARRVASFPKVELHLHAEAAVWPSFYSAWNSRLGLFTDADLPSLRSPFSDFGAFVKAWVDNLRFARDASFYRELGLAVAQRLHDEHIVYAEVHLSPCDTAHYRARWSPGEPVLDAGGNVRAFVEGLRMAEGLFPEVTVRVVVDRVSFATEVEDHALLSFFAGFLKSPEAFDQNGRPFVVAVGMGGPEKPGLAPYHREALARYRALGLKVDLHSGEQPSVSAAEHRAQCEAILPDRVGHGFRGWAEGYAFSGPIALCPSSNVLTGSLPEGLQAHPVAEMFARGSNISINTDDPLLFGTTLVLEYVALRRAFGLGWDFFETTQANARRAAFSTGGELF